MDGITPVAPLCQVEWRGDWNLAGTCGLEHRGSGPAYGFGLWVLLFVFVSVFAFCFCFLFFVFVFHAQVKSEAQHRPPRLVG
jgi:hypothetical protein